MSYSRLEAIKAKLTDCGINHGDASYDAIKQLLSDYDADLCRYRLRASNAEQKCAELEDAIVKKNDELRKIAALANIAAPVQVRNMSDRVPRVPQFTDVSSMVEHMKETYECRIVDLKHKLRSMTNPDQLN